MAYNGYQASHGNFQPQSSRLGFSSHLLPPRYQLNQGHHQTPQAPFHGTPDYQSSTYAPSNNALPPRNQFYHYQAPSIQQPQSHGRFVQFPDAQRQATQFAPQIPHDIPQYPQLPVPVPPSTATSTSTRARRRTGKARGATKPRPSLSSKPLATAQWPPPYTPFSDLPQALQMHYWSVSLRTKRPVEDIVKEEYAKTIRRGPPQSIAAYFSSESATDSDSDTTSAQWQAGQKRPRISSGGLQRHDQQMKRARIDNHVPPPALSEQFVDTEVKVPELQLNSDAAAAFNELATIVQPNSESNPMAELFAMIEAAIKLKTPEELAEDMKERPVLPEHEYIRDAVYSFFP